MQILLEKASGILENIAAWKSSQPLCRGPRECHVLGTLLLLWVRTIVFPHDRLGAAGTVAVVENGSTRAGVPTVLRRAFLSLWLSRSLSINIADRSSAPPCLLAPWWPL